jgi:hypothetical protein
MPVDLAAGEILSAISFRLMQSAGQLRIIRNRYIPLYAVLMDEAQTGSRAAPHY